MKTCTSRKRFIVLFTVLLLILLLACSVGSPERAELSNEDQVATGVAATQLARTPGALAATAQPPAQQNPNIPLPTAVSDQPSNQQLAEAGMSRANPLPPGVLASVPNWDIQVLEYYRGQEALARINAGAKKEISAPAGMEIVLVKFFVRCTSFEDDNFSLGIFDLALTGNNHVLYADRMDEWPQPEFYYKDMFTAEAVEGWLDVIVPAGEQNLMAVINIGHDVSFLALEPGSAIVLPAEFAGRAVNDAGMTRDNPTGIGELVSMVEWDLTLLEVMGGPEADALLQQNNNRYEAPEAGLEYSLLHFKVQYFGEQEWPINFSFYNFWAVDAAGNRIGDTPRYVQNPDRNYLSDTILPGAVVDGWVILQVPQGGTPYLVEFSYSSYSDDVKDERRYFSID